MLCAHIESHHYHTRRFTIRMDTVRFVLVLIITHMPNYQSVQCSKRNKLEIGLNVLNKKLFTLEETLFKDKIETQYEIQNMWKILNESLNGMDNINTRKTTEKCECNGTTDIRNVHDRITMLLTSFKDEKTTIRRHIDKFESRMKAMEKQQDEAVMNLTRFAGRQLTDINKTINEEYRISKELVGHKLADLQKLQEKITTDLKNNVQELRADLNISLTEGLRKVADVQERASSRALEIEGIYNTLQDTVNDNSANVAELNLAVSKISAISRCLSQGGKVYQDSCYKMSSSRATSSNAVKECEKTGAYLAVVDNVEDSMRINDQHGTSGRRSLDRLWSVCIR